MQLSLTSTLTLLLTLFLSSSVLAHPPNFSPNHALLPRACPPFDPAGVKNIGNGVGKQFIGGQCLGTADCQSGCCAKPCGICSGPAVGDANGKTGCGFESTGATGAGTGANTNGGTGASVTSTIPVKQAAPDLTTASVSHSCTG